MEREPVDSSNLLSVGYDDASETLEVEFKGGNVYQYYGVPQLEHVALRSAQSVGSYFSGEHSQRLPLRKALGPWRERARSRSRTHDPLPFMADQTRGLRNAFGTSPRPVPRTTSEDPSDPLRKAESPALTGPS